MALPAPLPGLPRLVRYTSGEWSALYIDGVRVSFGDHYVVDDYLAALFGIEMREDNDDFINGRTVFDNLADVEAIAASREND